MIFGHDALPLDHWFLLGSDNNLEEDGKSPSDMYFHTVYVHFLVEKIARDPTERRKKRTRTILLGNLVERRRKLGRFLVGCRFVGLG